MLGTELRYYFKKQPVLFIAEPSLRPLNPLYLEAKSFFLICHPSVTPFPSPPLSPNNGILWVLSVTPMMSQVFVCWSLLDLLFCKDRLDGRPEACLSSNPVGIDVGSHCCEGRDIPGSFSLCPASAAWLAPTSLSAIFIGGILSWAQASCLSMWGSGGTGPAGVDTAVDPKQNVVLTKAWQTQTLLEAHQKTWPQASMCPALLPGWFLGTGCYA